MADRRRERKVVTVLFADLVGFTSRAESLDPEDVEAILHPYHERLRSELERHGGTVEKFIGDAVVAVFGAPLVHEDDAERAVRAALAIRDAIMEDGTLEVRIGVNTGEALVNLDARPDAGEGMAAGDVVNTGARLQAAAPTNGVLVGEATFQATKQTIEYREHEPIEAKGKIQPVPVWEAVQARSRVEVEVRRPRVPLVGRDHALNVLVASLARVRQERAAQLVTLVGEPGIGKSRLISELFESVESQPELIWWRYGRSLPYGEGVSFWALGQMIKSQAGILETDSGERAEAKLRSIVEGMNDAEWLLAHLRPLVGLGGENQLADQRAEAFTAWRRFFEELADQHPLVLVFEDLHWADDGLLDFVDHLVDWSAGVQLLVVASTRPELLERRPDWGGGKRNAFTVSLTALPTQENARLLGALLGRSVLPAETQTRLLQRAGGNPLYTEELARMLIDRGGVETLPETIQGVIAARLDALTPIEKSLLQEAAVVGRVFWLGALEAMSGVPREQLEERLHGLERKEFIRRERRSSVEGDYEYLFHHVLVRDVAYGQIPRAERGKKHELAASWIEQLARTEDTAEMLAHHYEQAIEYARATTSDTTSIEERARRAFAEAGARTLALQSYAAAMRYYGAALALTPSTEERGELLLQHAYAAHFTLGGQSVDVIRAARDELAAGGELTKAAELTGLLSWVGWSRGEGEEIKRGLADMRTAAAQLERAPASRAKAFVLQELARETTLFGGEGALEAAEQALAAARAAGARDLEARGLNTLGLARMNAGDPSGFEQIEESLALAEEIPSPIDVCRAYINLSALTSQLGDQRKADEYKQAGTAAAERWGIETSRRWFRALVPEMEYGFGNWGAALRSADEFLDEVEAGSPHYLEHAVRSVRARIRFAYGDTSGAFSDEARALEQARSLGDPQALEPVLAISAFFHAEMADRTIADQRLSETLELWRQDPEADFDPSDATFAALNLGRTDEILAVAATVSTTRWLEAACAVANGDYERAADLYREIGFLPHEAYARLASGESAQVQRALEFYNSVGATRYVKQAKALLPASA